MHEEGGQEEVTALKIINFLGVVPKNSAELLPDTAAQVAENCKLYSGDLIPYPLPVITANTGRTGETRTLYALRDPDTDEPVWLSWPSDVDIVTPAADEIDEQRFYYAGDGRPKVSTYELATSGVAPYPTGFYELGLPLPTDTPTATATAFTAVPTASFARSAGNNVTITTGGPAVAITGITQANPAVVTAVGHGFTTGDVVRISDVGGMGAVNDLSFTITAIDADTFSLDGIDSSAYDAYTSGGVVALASAPHNLKTGAFVTVSGFAFRTGTYSQAGSTVTVTIAGHGLTTGAFAFIEFTTGGALPGSYSVTVVDVDTFTIAAQDSATRSGNARWDIRDLNITTDITVIDDTTISYRAAGPAVTTTANTDGRVDLGGAVLARNYLYTWFTPWQEESVGSIPSEPLFMQEGQIATVAGLPTAPPAGTFVRGIRLYRSVAGSNGTSEFFRLSTLWFPNPLARASRTANVSRVRLESPHNLLEGDRVKISGAAPASFDITDGVVTALIDQYTFEYAQAAADVADAAATGTLYYDSAERAADPARYWGDGGVYTFVDNFSFRSLLNILATDNYNAPPEDLQGLAVLKNNILVGFVGNDLYFSEPGKFHAWPVEYKQSLEHNIIKVVPIAGDLIVLTDSYPYAVSGSDPRTLSIQKFDARYPCVSRRSVALTASGVVFSSHDGLVSMGPLAGPQVLSAKVHSSDTWNESLDPETVVGANYKEVYFAAHSTGSFVYEALERGASFVNSDYTFSATWYDPLTNILYYTSGENGDVYRWDDSTQPAATLEWKSKTFITPLYTNVGAARVVADYTGAVFSSVWGTADINWEAAEENWDQDDPLTFSLYVDKQLEFTTTLDSSDIFRLPTGYKSDTFEFGVSGTIRVRSIHVGETPSALVRV